MRRVVLLVVVLALVATSCGGDDGQPATTGAAVDRSPGALEVALTTAGIGIVDEPEGGGSPAGLKLSEFQVANMARELDRGQGYLGAELDRLGGSPGGVPFSFLIAGWLSASPTRTAQAAASLMGEQQWEQASAIVYPTAVLMLFASDAVASASSESGEDEAASAARDFEIAQPRPAATAPLRR